MLDSRAHLLVLQDLPDQCLAAPHRAGQLVVRPPLRILGAQSADQAVALSAMLISLVAVSRRGLVVFAGLLGSSVHLLDLVE